MGKVSFIYQNVEPLKTKPERIKNLKKERLKMWKWMFNPVLNQYASNRLDDIENELGELS